MTKVAKSFAKTILAKSQTLPEFQLFRIKTKIINGIKHSNVTMMNGDVYSGYYDDILNLLAKEIIKKALKGMLN
jgi:hypothetical protein